VDVEESADTVACAGEIQRKGVKKRREWAGGGNVNVRERSELICEESADTVTCQGIEEKTG